MNNYFIQSIFGRLYINAFLVHISQGNPRIYAKKIQTTSTENIDRAIKNKGE